MSDGFRPLGAGRLAEWISREIDGSGSVFGIPRELWFAPTGADRFAFDLRGARLQTPIGVAAGPHTQLAQNIVTAWLCGARVIELKTVQTLDRIDVKKPCIDMRDEGYNIEWSQELTVQESFTEYLLAWVLIHTLHAELSHEGEGPGVLFDLSVGYDLAGIRQENMRWYLEHMADSGEELERCVTEVARSFPCALDLEIPSRIANSVTLSTLHGCPPDEIGAIAEHLLESWDLHTAVKLNPTLLGYETVREILVDQLHWTNVEPHRPAFDADIGYADAIALTDRLQRFGDRRGLDFSVKLCNTLPVVNRCSEFADDEPTAYLSGRPLHALAVELARRLTDDTRGMIDISFAGGADAFNTPALLAAGLRPVTTCSDLLRPGGYLRLGQYFEEIDAALDGTGAGDLDELIIGRAPGASDVAEAASYNLDIYADSLREDPELMSGSYRRKHTKTGRSLGFFDCIEAPCTDACSVSQQVPSYMRRVAAGDIDGAAEIITRDNPLPAILGRACHHPCEPVCLRTHLDQPVAIREIKRFAMDNAHLDIEPKPFDSASQGVAVIGAGPCGLAAAAELARAGVRTVIFESREEGGGMVSATIPGYRASADAVHRDLEAIVALGVEVRYGVSVGRDPSLEDLLRGGFSDVVVAIGAQRGLHLGLEGEDSGGVLDGLDFLREARHGTPGGIGRRVAVIGGGDVAMDCARSAKRLSGDEVEILYRRTIDEMPAHPEEIRDLTAEGITIRELVAPRRIVTDGHRLRALECATMTLGEPDASGRPRPVEVPGGEVTLDIDTLIIAIGQKADLGVFHGSDVRTSRSGYLVVDEETLETSLPRVFAGGDLREPGPSNIVDACGDGQRIARAILTREGRPPIDHTRNHWTPPDRSDRVDLLARRAHRLPRVEIPRKQKIDHRGFDEMIVTLGPEAAALEAARCLDCDHLCSTCDGVCPNRAIATYFIEPSTPTPEPKRDRDGLTVPRQEPQVAVFADLCNECGNCATFCPTVGRPYVDKPRIFFDRSEFEAETDNAFMLLKIDGRSAIQGRFQGVTKQLVDGSATEVTMMSTLLSGLTTSMPHLPMPEADPEWLVDRQ
jgi:putative selenate reductase